MLSGPFSPWPTFTQEEADAISHVLLSNKVNYWTGQECREFEREFAAFAGTEYAIAVANGTLALDLALQGLGIGAGDEVVVTPRTFLASATSVINAGATPVFADVDPDTQNITPETVDGYFRGHGGVAAAGASHCFVVLACEDQAEQPGVVSTDPPVQGLSGVSDGQVPHHDRCA